MSRLPLAGWSPAVAATAIAAASWCGPAPAQTLPSGTLSGGTLPGGTLGAPAPAPIQTPAAPSQTPAVPAQAPAAPVQMPVAPAATTPTTEVPADATMGAPAAGGVPTPVMRTPLSVVPNIAPGSVPAAAARAPNPWAGGPAMAPPVPAQPQTSVPMPNGRSLPVAPPTRSPPTGFAARPAPAPAARPPLPPAAPAPPAQPAKGLPPDAPPVTITGGVYSPNAKHRLAIVNGQVVREGAELGSGLVLEQITPVDVVLAFRGARYRVMF
jgi:general secretion pathway protein B